jgi:hypothetical protein
LNRSYARSDKVISYEIHLTHRPTGVKVTGKIGPAQRTKAEWQMAREKERDRLMVELERAVAKRLRLPGR